MFFYAHGLEHGMVGVCFFYAHGLEHEMVGVCFFMSMDLNTGW